MYEHLDNKMAVLYAASVYDNPQCMTREEFVEDFKRFKYIKRLCRRYLSLKNPAEDFGGERLLLNHLILLTNVFGIEATVRILFVKCENERMWRVLKPFLHAEKYLPRVVKGIDGKDIQTDDIPMDESLLYKIREICSNDLPPS